MQTLSNFFINLKNLCIFLIFMVLKIVNFLDLKNCNFLDFENSYETLQKFLYTIFRTYSKNVQY